MPLDRNAQLSTWTGARQTMSSWARVMESYDDVPEAFRDATEILKERPLFPYTVFAPAIVGLPYKTTEKLLCEVGNALYIWERMDDRVVLTAFSRDNISDFEFGNILLYSWITIGGATQTGIPCATTVEFNYATLRHFVPFINRLRPASEAVPEHEHDLERAKFDYLAAESFKFMNYGFDSLVAGEKVLQTVWQPKLSKPAITLGGRTIYRATLLLPHLVILTDKELIVIEDDERSRENRGVRYGGKWRYIGLSHIRTVLMHERTDDLWALSLALAPGERQVEILFAPSQRQKIAQLQVELEDLIGERPLAS